MRVLFWGTPDFATPALRALLGEGFDVVGVVTRPDKPQGRSRSRVVSSPIKALAIAEQLPVLEPADPRAPGFLDEIAALEPDVSAVVAYGHILSQAVLDAAPRGTFNVHASLLPALRGAAPIQAAIRQGLRETGVTVMRLVPALDAGPILLQLRTPIAPDETAGELQLRLSELGAQALLDAMALIALGDTSERSQDDARATYAPKIDRGQTRIDWTAPAAAVLRQLLAYDPKPGAFTSLHGTEIKCFEGHVTATPAPLAPGAIHGGEAEGIVVECGSGAIRIVQVQPAGRSRMTAAAWMRGRSAAAGDRFE
jgi:methionyl-tRNA formyltransferase